MTREIKLSLIASFVFIAALLLTPVLTGVTNSGPLCSMGASAQDNPCLAQDATISAQEVQIFQLQGTIEALSAGGPPAASGSVDTPATGGTTATYVETFDDNSRGWALAVDDRAASRFAEGQLMLSTDTRVFTYVPVPGVSGDSFYIELDVTTDHERGFVGFAYGDFAEGSLNYVFLGRSNASWEWRVAAYEQEDSEARVDILYDRIYAERSAELWEAERTFQLAFELQGGLFTMYFNGEPVESLPLNYGTDVGIAYTSGSQNDLEAAFDNVRVSTSR